MQELIYGSYILFWPGLTLIMLILIIKAVMHDVRAARRDGTEMV